MKTNNKYYYFIAMLLGLFVFIQCEKDYIPNENPYHSHREDYQPTNCWTEISDWANLLPDSLMTIPEFSQIPQVDSNYINWLNNKYNRVDIRSLTSSNFSDLQCLKNYIGNRSIVQLGESSHGTKEYSQIKVRLIKFLHEEMGFDVIAFESGFFECFYTNENIPQIPVYPAMQNSIYWNWGTPELRDLFLYIKNTHNTNHPLILAGIDCQFSSKLGSISKHPSFLFDVISKVDSSYAFQCMEFDSLTIFNIASWNVSYLISNRDIIRQQYLEILDFIDNHKSEINNAFSQRQELPEVLIQSTLSLMTFLDIMCIYDVNETEYYRKRDSSMAANFFFLKEYLYPQKKIIIWAHNYHISNGTYFHAFSPDVKVTGNWIYEKYNNDLYTIGLYMLRGKTITDWDFSEIDVDLPSSPYSLEAILYHCRKKTLFVDLLHQQQCSGNKWMFNTITAKYSGFANESMIIRNVYDGVIFIDSSSVPDYLP